MNCVRLINASTGTISTLVGTCANSGGYGGDGSLARDPSVKLLRPEGLSDDASGNLYIGE